MDLKKKLQIAVAIFIAVFMTGTSGYRILGMSWIDSAYMTLITLTTVGFGEITTDDHLTNTTSYRLFTMFILITGMGVLMYGVTTATAFIVEGELSDLLKRRKMDKQIAGLEGHTIVCGIGHIGRYIIDELKKTLRPFVVIDNDKAELERMEAALGGFLYVLGDASEDAVLERAGISRAAGVVTTFGDDRMNLFVTLSARNLNPKARIVTRAVDVQSVEKIKRSGADSVVSTNQIGGMRLISELVRPAVTGFLDIMLREKSKTLRIEEARIGEKSELVGMTLDAAEIQERTTMAVVAIRDGKSGEYRYTPPADTVLKAGDDLIVLGEVGRLATLRKLAATPS